MSKPSQQKGNGVTGHVAFEHWMDQHGFDHAACTIHTFKETGRGVMAAQNIARDATVLKVPDTAVLLAEESDISQLVEGLRVENRASDMVNSSIPLIIVLMVEKLKGNASKWAAYIDFLPQGLEGLPFQWGKDNRRILRGTSTLHAETIQPYGHPPAAVWDIFREVVEPWFTNTSGVQPPEGGEDALWHLYSWATAIVAAYSFELGNDRLQCLVPLWDALNHVTGKANVRLSHDAKRGSLLMIATRNIAHGEQLVNDYGPLSNGDLLRRYGFVEPCRMPLQQLERVAAQVRVGECVSGATLAHAHWQPPNVHDAAVVPLQDVIRAAATHGGYGDAADKLQARLDFLQEWGVIPDDQRFWVACDGELQPAGAEAFRILSLSGASFRAFRTSVKAWRPPLPVPCSGLHVLDLGKRFQMQWCRLVVAAVATRRGLLPPPSLALEVVASAEGLESVAMSGMQAAATVAVGEWVALDSCLARVVGQVLDGASMRMMCLEASDDACPRPRGGIKDAVAGTGSEDADAGAPWLLQLSRRFWVENMTRLYDKRMGDERLSVQK
eukprot:jgi/Ulvmu1/5281/UM022_0075.1